MIAAFGASVLRMGAAKSPFIPGMATSRTTRSGGLAIVHSMAFAASLASTSETLAKLEVMRKLRLVRNNSLSSTIRIVFGMCSRRARQYLTGTQPKAEYRLPLRGPARSQILQGGLKIGADASDSVFLADW